MAIINAPAARSFPRVFNTRARLSLPERALKGRPSDSPPRRGGVARQPAGWRAGVVRPEKCFAGLLLRLRPIGLALRATPSALAFARRIFPSSARRGMLHALDLAFVEHPVVIRRLAARLR